MKAFGGVDLCVDTFEGDDVIATLCHKCEDLGVTSVVVSTDKGVRILWNVC